MNSHAPRPPDVSKNLVADGKRLLGLCPHDLHGLTVAVFSGLQGLRDKGGPEGLRKGTYAGSLVVGDEAGFEADGPQSPEQLPAPGVRGKVRRDKGIVDIKNDAPDALLVQLLKRDHIGPGIIFFGKKRIHALSAVSSPGVPGASSAPA